MSSLYKTECVLMDSYGFDIFFLKKDFGEWRNLWLFFYDGEKSKKTKLFYFSTKNNDFKTVRMFIEVGKNKDEEVAVFIDGVKRTYKPSVFKVPFSSHCIPCYKLCK